MLFRSAGLGFYETFNGKNKNENNLVHIIINKHPTLINILLSYVHTDYFTNQDSNGNTIFHILAKNNNIHEIREHIGILKQLINIKNNTGDTVPIVAAKYGHELLLRYLLKIGCDTNICDNNGNTIFHYICMNNMCFGFTVVNKENNYGFRPSDYTDFKTYWNFIY